MNQSDWYLNDQNNLPDYFLNYIKDIIGQQQCHYLARLLWNRGVRDIQQLEFLLDTKQYQPTSYLEFGEEINLAIQRISKARITREKIAIWGNWQVGSIMSTCILIEGLEQFLSAKNLRYYFPHRHQSYFGLHHQGIDELAQQEVTLIIVANTGSHNLDEVNYAHTLGIDIIIIDRPVLSSQRPSVVSWLNPHNLSPTHPFYHFSGVAIAYKLIEGLATEFSDSFSQPVTNLLDLVALGMLADANNLNLQAEARYLAKEGMELIKQEKRPNITALAETGFQIGDRALDISYGLVNRIRAISRIYRDASFVINLLTSKNFSTRNRLADQAEKAYFNYLDLVQKILDEARKKIQNIDLSNTLVIVLQNDQWHIGVLNLVAKVITEEYGKPTILLSTNFHEQSNSNSFGYVYSLPDFDLSQVIIDCSSLLNQYTVENAGINIVIPTENISLFTEIITQKIRQKINNNSLTYKINIDLVITIKELGQSLYQQLKLLEPYSLDNPSPKLLINNCRLTNIGNVNLKNYQKGKEVRYKKTYFQVHDNSCKSYFNGIWWGHYAQEINYNNYYDIVGEIEYNTAKEYYYFRLLDLKMHHPNNYIYDNKQLANSILDYRDKIDDLDINNSQDNIIKKCPTQWQQLTSSYQNAIEKKKKLILGYEDSQIEEIEKMWLEFISLIKSLLVNNKIITIDTLSQKINVSQLCLTKILRTLSLLAIEYSLREKLILFTQKKQTFSPEDYKLARQKFMNIIKQENLYKKYFYQVSVNDLEREMHN